jgi:hypothetical protein
LTILQNMQDAREDIVACVLRKWIGNEVRWDETLGNAGSREAVRVKARNAVS